MTETELPPSSWVILQRRARDWADLHVTDWAASDRDEFANDYADVWQDSPAPMTVAQFAREAGVTA
jgi:hypothetical protein